MKFKTRISTRAEKRKHTQKKGWWNLGYINMDMCCVGNWIPSKAQKIKNIKVYE
jgi:hypothetical protein